MKTTLPTPLASTALILAMVSGSLAGCGSLQLQALADWPGAMIGRITPDAETENADMAQAEEPASEAAPESQESDSDDPGPLYEWHGRGRKVSRVIINTDEQKARFYVGDEQVGWTTVATGVEAFPTPTGRFEVIEKVADKRSNLYGRIYNADGQVVKWNARQGRDEIPPGGRFVGAEMPYFLRLTYDGVGLHAGNIPEPGQPASHGCIRLPEGLAPQLFANVSRGTPMTIVGSGPSYGDYAEQVRQAARERAARSAHRESRPEQSRPAGSEPTGAVSSPGAEERGSAPSSADVDVATAESPATTSGRPLVLDTGAPEPRVVAEPTAEVSTETDEEGRTTSGQLPGVDLPSADQSPAGAEIMAPSVEEDSSASSSSTPLMTTERYGP